jgi:hypothetical protein
MSKPSVNVVLRLDSSKVKDDAEKAKSFLTTSIGPTVDVFGVATKAVELFGKSLEIAGRGLVFLTERTGAAQSLAVALDDTRKAIGEAADRSGALKTAMGAIERAAESVAGFFRSDEGREAINKFFGTIAKAASLALDALNGFLKVVRDIRDQAEVRSLLPRVYLGAVKGFFEGGKEEALKNIQGIVDSAREAAKPRAENAFMSLLTELADGFLAAADLTKPKNQVQQKGTYVDEEARKKREADLKWEMDGIRAQRQAEQDTIRGAEEFNKAEREAAMKALDSRREIAQLEAKIEKAKTDNYISNAERRIAIADAEQARSDEQLALIQADASSKIGVVSGLADSITSTWAEMVQGFVTGQDLGPIVARALGGAIASLGASAFAAGTIAAALGTLGLFVPAIGAAFPPAAIPLGLAAAALGTVAMGGGAYIMQLASGGSSSGGAGGRPTSHSNMTASVRGTGFRGTPEGFQDGGNRGSVTTILNYNFNGPMGGSPRRIAREIRDLTTAGDTLLPGFRPVGGR